MIQFSLVGFKKAPIIICSRNSKTLKGIYFFSLKFESFQECHCFFMVTCVLYSFPIFDWLCFGCILLFLIALKRVNVNKSTVFYIALIFKQMFVVILQERETGYEPNFQREKSFSLKIWSLPFGFCAHSYCTC